MPDAEFAEAIRAGLREELGELPECISIGITGTRNLPTDNQRHTLRLMVNSFARCVGGERQLHHGMCVGTDECAHYIAAQIPRMKIYGHPGPQSRYRMQAGHDLFTLIYDAKPFRARNSDIVQASGILLACPRYPEQDARSARSGTWQTIRFARRAHKPVILVIPSGAIIHDHTHNREQ